MNKEELEQRLLTVFSQQKLENYGIGLAIYYLAKVVEEKLDNEDKLNEYPPGENPSNECPFNIISVFKPVDRLDELDEVPKIGDDIDYWTAAKLLCEKDGGHLATREELAQIASQIYEDEDGTPLIIKQDKDINDMRVKDEYIQNPPIKYDGYGYWSSEEYIDNFVYGRLFTSSSTYWGFYIKTDNYYRAVCISNKVK